MALNFSPPIYEVGDIVEIRHYDHQKAKIVELRGPLGPGGVQIYRVRVRGRQPRVYIELREDQLILIRKRPSREEGGNPVPENPPHVEAT